MAASVWVVSVMYEDDDNREFGPYTKTQAERVAERLRVEAAMGQDNVGICQHPHGVSYATAYPLGRYEDFLTSEEKREMRTAVRASNKERKNES